MEIKDILEQSGLNQKEANIYLALLELGSSSVQGVALKAGIKRPTAYLVLDELKQKGLVSMVPQKKALYTAESPERLLLDLNKKQELTKRFLPDLLALHNAKKEKPQVQLFQGKEGVAQVYDKVFQYDEVWFFGTIREVLKVDPQGLNEFLKKTKHSQVRIKEIITDTPEDREYAKQWQGAAATHEFRFIPKDIKWEISDSAVFGDSVVFFSFHPQIFAVVITSKEVSGIIKTLFEMAWKSATRFE